MENQGERDEVPFPSMAGSWYHQCYDDETEILTRDGWKPFEELTEQDGEILAEHHPELYEELREAVCDEE